MGVDENTPAVPNTTIILDAFREPLWENDKRFTVLQGGGGSGKAVPADAKVITPHGYKLMKDIQVGDYVCDTHGGVTKVLNKYHPPTTQMYKLKFEDGREAIACKDHQWSCWVAKNAKKKSKQNILTTEEMYIMFSQVRRIAIPVSDATYHTKKNLIIDPYLLGLLLGDGYCGDRYCQLTTDDEEVADWLITNGYSHTGYSKNNTTAKTYRICNITKSQMDLTEISGKHAWEKRIPTEYLYSSIHDRYELLRGLLDTDGTVSKSGQISFCTTSKQLAEDVSQLVRSLGGKATTSIKQPHYKDTNGNIINGRLAYNLYIRFKDASTPVFKIKRKQDRVKPYDGGRYDMRLRLESIEPISYEGDIYCITVDAGDSLYQVEDYVVTHNSHAICQYLCYLFLTYDDVIIAVIRESMPILKKTVYMGDPSIVRTLRDWNVPVDDWWNKTDTTITNPHNKSEIRFIGLDSSEKIKSQNWNYCWLEEATELTLEKWSQCNTRMRRPNKHGPDRMIISYNPINIYNWVIQQFVVNPSPYIKENTFVHFSNFLDNPFLPKEAIISMMDTAEKDENYYWTYVIGKPGIPVGQIYTNFKFSPRDGLYEEDPNGGEPIEIIPPWDKELENIEPYYGIDFGYVDPMVVTEFKEYKDTIYVRCRYYETNRTTRDLIEFLREIGVTANHMLYCDSAEQDRIHELAQAGFCPNNATKDIHAGIMYMKGKNVVVDSTGKLGECARNEIQGYMWDKDKDDPRILLDKPAKDQQDHFCDTVRYGPFTKHLRDTEFSTVPLDMGDGNSGRKSSADILKEMSKLISKY